MDNNMCLIPIGGRSEHGISIWLWQCNDARYRFSWQLSEGGFISYGDGIDMVMGVDIGNIASGVPIKLLSKNPNAKRQQWKRRWSMKND